MTLTVSLPTLAGPASWWQFWKPGVSAADEAWVVQKLNSIEQGAILAAADLNNVLGWTFNNFDSIAADVAKMIALAGALGLGNDPTVAAAELAANAVLAAIAAAKAKSQGGNVSAVSAAASEAYTAVKQLQAAHATAAVAVATNGKAHLPKP